MVETGRHASKIQRYGRIYEEVRALRKETRHSVQDLRERYKEKGVIQNKDQFIVKLIAQVRFGGDNPVYVLARACLDRRSSLGLKEICFFCVFSTGWQFVLVYFVSIFCSLF